jgi:hypothetical protein
MRARRRATGRRLERRLALVALVAAVGCLACCAPSPPPRIMSQVEAVRSGPAGQEAKRLAPQGYAHAEALRRRAEQAHRDDDLAGAQILSEHALAAYAHAFALARLAQAQQRLAQARARLAEVQTELSALGERQQRIAAEADDLELRVKVVQDAVPLVPNQPATPERERARLDAARSMAQQGQLLCAATGLLSPAAEGLAEHLARIQALEKKLASGPTTVPIDEAIELRSACLRLLTLARRPATRRAPAAGQADALLAALSAKGSLFPFRDDRGVVVTLRGVVTRQGMLTKAGAERLALLGRVAKANPGFPVLVVVHSARGAAAAGDEATAKAVCQALTDAGAPKVEARTVGDAQPVIDPTTEGAAARNARIEVVFVSPSS